jgi:hypothetical protein
MLPPVVLADLAAAAVATSGSVLVVLTDLRATALAAKGSSLVVFAPFDDALLDLRHGAPRQLGPN